MKIWFDLSNSPHINMFHDLIKELEGEGHDIIITCRPLANTIDLLQQKNLSFTVIGEHYGKNLYKKIFGYPIRVFQLWMFLKNHRLDLAVSQSSFHSPLVARLLGIPSIYTNDNEHAMGNIPSFIFATQVLIPENLSVEKILKKGSSKIKTKQYPGVKEGIYLWRKSQQVQKKRKELVNDPIKIFVRPEPLTAQYYKGGLNFMDEALIELQNNYAITILPRDNTQKTHYKQSKFSKIIVVEKPLEFDYIAENCTVFIGAGGSMTREIALLGIPTISVYQDELLDVDEYILKKGLMKHEPQLTASKIISFMESISNKNADFELMEKGKEAYYFIKNQILKYNNQ
ncbi:DUF354 domain-containing protein [Solitalea sp. MAHUQ-68]|uniref:DUF354 domain-containing protein n=1 Tax=Solitalea agri TaxID=2953739 RepID=A0A9X2FB70_9SPHI|nr:DUF354 domain-containing protein [Solitalea agri]MCO4293683.1 DUF354 domain-containing protein [Solitalea agri]